MSSPFLTCRKKTKYILLIMLLLFHFITYFLLVCTHLFCKLIRSLSYYVAELQIPSVTFSPFSQTTVKRFCNTQQPCKGFNASAFSSLLLQKVFSESFLLIEFGNHPLLMRTYWHLIAICLFQFLSRRIHFSFVLQTAPPLLLLFVL